MIPNEIPEESEVNAVLAHYGIKGMRWGVRRKRGKGGRVEGGSSSKSESSKPKSDAELREAVNRMQLQKQYKDLNAALNPKKESKAVKMATQIMTNVATQQGTRILNNQVGNLLDAAFAGKKKEPPASKLDAKELKETVKRKRLEKEYESLRK